MKLYTAALDNYQLAILDITDNLSHSLVQHEYLNTDGADIQTVGAKARTIRFKAYFFGEDFDLEQAQLTVNVPTGGSSAYRPPSYKNHFDFVNFLSTNVQGVAHTLYHPKYGIIKGYVSSYSVTHDDTQDYCTIDIDFIEDEIKNKSLVPSTEEISMTAEYVTQLNNTLASAGNAMKAAGNASVLGISINRAISLTNQINRYISTATRTFINEVESNIQTLNTFYNNIEDIADTVENTVNYVSDIPSELIGSMNRACNRMFQSLETVVSSPMKFWNTSISQLNGLKETLSGTYQSFFQQQFMAVSSVALINKATELLTSDQGNKIIPGQAFDINGNRISITTITPGITRQDIESMVYQLQIYVQAALVLNREQPALRASLAKVNNWVNYIKLSRLVVKTITVSNMPLHMLLCQLGQSYEMADVTLALNPQIRNPAFVTGAVKVYVSA